MPFMWLYKYCARKSIESSKCGPFINEPLMSTPTNIDIRGFDVFSFLLIELHPPTHTSITTTAMIAILDFLMVINSRLNG